MRSFVAIFTISLTVALAPVAPAQTLDTSVLKSPGVSCDTATPKFGFASNLTPGPGYRCFQYSLGSTRGMIPGAKQVFVNWHIQTIQNLQGGCGPNASNSEKCLKTLSRICASRTVKVRDLPPPHPLREKEEIYPNLPVSCPAPGDAPNKTGPLGCSAPCTLSETPAP